jgi:hypothetical protein
MLSKIKIHNLAFLISEIINQIFSFFYLLIFAIALFIGFCNFIVAGISNKYRL